MSESFTLTGDCSKAPQSVGSVFAIDDSLAIAMGLPTGAPKSVGVEEEALPELLELRKKK